MVERKKGKIIKNLKDCFKESGKFIALGGGTLAVLHVADSSNLKYFFAFLGIGSLIVHAIELLSEEE